MSKLKWNWVYYPYLDPPEKQKESSLKAGYNKVYLKSEADAVLAEKDKVIAELEMKLATVQQVLRLNEPEALYSNLETMGRLSHEIGVVARRERYQKYKRCLAMAKWCMARYNEWAAYYPTTTTRKMKFLDKWHKRWREIAEKFKEAK